VSKPLSYIDYIDIESLSCYDKIAKQLALLQKFSHTKEGGTMDEKLCVSAPPRCPKCAQLLFADEKHCSYCGFLNENFDPIVFQKHALRTFEEVQKEECEKNHQLFTDIAHKYPEMKYCVLCGKKLSPV